jgi:hypothetical protein
MITYDFGTNDDAMLGDDDCDHHDELQWFP